MAKPVFNELLERQIKVTKICGYTIALFFGVALSISYFFFDAKHLLFTISCIYAIAVLANALLYDLHKRIYINYLVLISLSFLEIVTIICYTGFIVSPALFMLIMFPVSAFSTSRKQGIFWSAIVFLTILILYVVSPSEISEITIILNEHQSFFSFAVVLFVLALIFIISYFVNLSTTAVHRAFVRDSEELSKKDTRLENLATLLNYSTDLICLVNLQTITVDDMNPTFKIKLGFELSEVRDKKITDFIKMDGRTSSLESDIKSMVDEQIIEFECQMLCKDGTEKSYSWMGIANNGKLHAMAREISPSN
ncbi:MAG: hypothetical protein ABII90_06720 [Bacteroidota bacterium]